MAIDTSKYGPPPRNTATPLPGAPGTVYGITMPTASTPVFQNAPVGGPYYTGPSHPIQFGPPPPPAPVAPRPAPAPPPAAAPPPPDPRDSTYYQNVATHDFDVNNQIAGLQQRQAYGTDDLQRALVQLAHSQALNERTDRERANSSGLLSSTTLANTLGELTQSGADRQSALQTQNSRQIAAIAAQIAALRGGQQLFDQGQLLAAVGRRSAADAANPALGETPPPAPPPGGGGSGGTGGAPGTPSAPIQIYRPRTDPTGQHLLPPVPGQPPLVRPARLPPAPPPPPAFDSKGPVRRRAY